MDRDVNENENENKSIACCTSNEYEYEYECEHTYDSLLFAYCHGVQRPATARHEESCTRRSAHGEKQQCYKLYCHASATHAKMCHRHIFEIFP
jgi:hypothetical protein